MLELVARYRDIGIRRVTLCDTTGMANPAQVEQYRGGKDGLLGFFVGQVMKETKGQADARAVNELVRAKLGA